MHKVFISYSRGDFEFADQAREALETNHIKCWIAPRDQLAGNTFGSQITDAICASEVMILIFSHSVNGSSAVQNEVFLAMDSGVAVLPFRIEDIEFNEELRYHLNRVHWLNAFPPPIEPHLERLVADVRGLLISRESGQPYTPAPPRPSPSMTGMKSWMSSRSAPWVMASALCLAVMGGAFAFVETHASSPAIGPQAALTPPPAPAAAAPAVQPPVAAQPAPAPETPSQQNSDSDQQPSGVALIDRLENGTDEGAMPTTLAGATVISTVDLDKFLISRGNGGVDFKLVDALGCGAHDSITGSVCLKEDNVDALQEAIPDKDTPIVIFCASYKCPESFSLAKAAVSVNYEHVYWYRGGIAAWKAAQLPMGHFDGSDEQ